MIEQHALPIDRVDTRSLVLRSDDGDWLHVRLVDDYYRIEPDDKPSPIFDQLLLSYEDRRYWDHFGVDVFAVGRALIENVTAGEIKSGASTITMQVSRLLKPHNRSLSGKIRQTLGALWLEKEFSKTEILNMYYLVAPYGGNIEGIEMASRYWFDKPSSELSISEAALLVAIPQNPYFHSPVLFPNRARKARDRVLRKGYESGLISWELYEDATLSPLPEAAYSFPQLSHHLADMFQLTGYSGYVDTTLKLELQKTMVQVVEKWSLDNDENLGVALLSKAGAVRGLIGSQDYFDSSRAGAVNYTQQSRSPGSTLKPLIYSYGETQGVLRFEDLFLDQPTNFGVYSPQNFDRKDKGLATFGESLISSENRAAVEALGRISPPSFAAAITSSGVKILGNVGLPLAVGGVGVSLIELCQLYTAFQNQGNVYRHYYESNIGPSKHPLITATAAERTNDLLRQVVLPSGRQNQSGRNRFGLKTGTGPRGSDALAIWYDAEHVVCVWVGTPTNKAKSTNTGISKAAPLALAVSDLLGQPEIPPSQAIGPATKRFQLASKPMRVVYPISGDKLVFPSKRRAIRLIVTDAKYPLTVRLNDLEIRTLETPKDRLIFPSDGFWNVEVNDSNLRSVRFSVKVVAAR